MKKLIASLILAGSATASFSQQIKPASSDKINHELQQLRHLVNVLYVAAHPDDENTRLLAWLVNDRNVRTGYLSLTRGDGGQNILGSEQGEALGLIRTHELMEARKLDGAEQYFTRAIDFGFSKTHEETFRHWSEYLLTYDAVWVMRKFRPDVVICRFPPNTMAGHGQHAASAIIGTAAYKKAGDKLQYTEQIHTYPAWQAKRLLQNTYRFGDRNTTSEDQFKVGVGQYIPGIGMGAGELAGISRSVHKSQGAGTPSTPGIQTEYFKLIAGDTLIQSLFDGIDMTWNRVGAPEIGDELKQIADNYDFRHPDASIPSLLLVRKKIAAVKDDYWRNEKMQEIDRAILDCSGLLAELYTKQPQAVRGAALPFTLRIIARSATPVTLTGVKWGNADTALNMVISGDTLRTLEHSISIPSNAPYTQPYWLSSARMEKQDLFTTPNDSLIGLPETPNDLNATIQLNIGGTELNVPVPLSYKKLDPVKGDIVEQLRIVPDATLSFNSTLLIAQADGSVEADIHVHAFKGINGATLTVSNGKTVAAKFGKIDLLQPNSDTTIHMTIPAKVAATLGSGDFYLMPELSVNDVVFTQSQHLIQYNHLPTLQYFNTAYTRVLRANWKCTVKKIGYIKTPEP